MSDTLFPQFPTQLAGFFGDDHVFFWTSHNAISLLPDAERMTQAMLSPGVVKRYSVVIGLSGAVAAAGVVGVEPP